MILRPGDFGIWYGALELEKRGEEYLPSYATESSVISNVRYSPARAEPTKA